MNDKLKIIIGVIVLLIMPVLMGVIVAKAIADHNGILLAIIFFSLIALELIAVIIKIIKYNKKKNEDD